MITKESIGSGMCSEEVAVRPTVFYQRVSVSGSQVEVSCSESEGGTWWCSLEKP